MEAHLLHFEVRGQHGPMTLTFRPAGKHPCAGGDITEDDARHLTLAEVQEWYSRDNRYPRAGHLQTYRRGKYCGIFQLV